MRCHKLVVSLSRLIFGCTGPRKNQRLGAAKFAQGAVPFELQTLSITGGGIRFSVQAAHDVMTRFG